MSDHDDLRAALEKYTTWCIDYQPEMYAPTVTGRAGADGKPICVKCEKSWLAHQITSLLAELATERQARAHVEQDHELLRAALLAEHDALVTAHQELTELHNTAGHYEEEILRLRAALLASERAREAEHARAVVAEQHKMISLLGKSSWQEEVEDDLRAQLAETQVELDAATRTGAQLREQVQATHDNLKEWADGNERDSPSLMIFGVINMLAAALVLPVRPDK